MTARILLADDHKILREGLRVLLESQNGLQIVGEADNGRIAVRLAVELKPDVVIMDVGMPELNGIDATRQIVRECPQTRVIALSMHSDGQFVSGMLRAGASGYLLKDSAFEELHDAVQTVLDGKVYLSPSVTGTIVDGFVRAQPAQPCDVVALTPREREVLQLLAEGKTTKQIAQRLRISVKTIETYRRQIMEKLNAQSVAELTKFAIRAGLTSLEA
ncbi:MAG: DNA-binding response regulator [Planctomycetota bacterium]|nr:MAG: DNA-binding response regulator [Planctomycetota bacterium]